jgi:hypothetical protein
MLLSKSKYLSLVVLLGMGGCTTNQYVTRSGAGVDDLYGGNSGPVIASRDRVSDQEYSRSNNPEYQQSYENTQGTADYYDESYLASSSVRRAVSTDVGYNAGFVDGYNQATRFSNGYGYNNFGSFYPRMGMGMGMSMMFGMGGFRMSPYLGMGSMYSLGYSPWGYGGMMGMYDPWGYGYGYNPWGMGSYYGAYGLYDSFYGGYGRYGSPVIVVNNYDRPGLARSFGPRNASNGNVRRANSFNNNFVNTPRSNADVGRGGRRSAESVSGNAYNATRSNRTSGYSAGRTSAESNANYSRSTARGTSASDGNTYYARPRSSASNGYSSSDAGGSYVAPRSSRSNGAGSTPTYSAPSRSQSNYNTAPSRSSNTYSSPSRSSNTYSSPARSSAPSYSAPARSSAPSYSAPSGGGGGGARSSSRGPR